MGWSMTLKTLLLSQDSSRLHKLICLFLFALLFPTFWWSTQGMVLVDTMESLGTPNSDSSLAHKAVAKVKSTATKSSKHMQLLDCLGLLPNDAKDAFLEQLRGFSSTSASSKKNLDEAESANSESAKDVKARLYDEHMEAECKTGKALHCGTKISSHELQTGLQINLVSRTDRDIGDVKVVLHKHNSGIDPIS
jgi:hypothetical protein